MDSKLSQNYPAPTKSPHSGQLYPENATLKTEDRTLDSCMKKQESKVHSSTKISSYSIRQLAYLPSAASIPAEWVMAVVPGTKRALTPALSAALQSPPVSPALAKCRLTKLEEQTVSMGIDGPLKPKVKEMRPAETLDVRCPVALQADHINKF